MRGVRIFSPGCRRRESFSMPARTVVGPAPERSSVARHWPDQPMAVIMPSSPYCTLKNGNAPLEERPPSGASATVLPGSTSVSSGRKERSPQTSPVN